MPCSTPRRDPPSSSVHPINVSRIRSHIISAQALHASVSCAQRHHFATTRSKVTIRYDTIYFQTSWGAGMQELTAAHNSVFKATLPCDSLLAIFFWTRRYTSSKICVFRQGCQSAARHDLFSCVRTHPLSVSREA